jgi:hypothetical protein
MRPVYDTDDSLDNAVPPGYRNASDKFKVGGEMTARAAELASVIIEDPEYLTNLLERARKGSLPPAIEKMLWEYRYGRPMEMGKMKGNGMDTNSLGEMSLEELAAMSAKNSEDARLLLEARAHKVGVSLVRGGRPS